MKIILKIIVISFIIFIVNGFESAYSQESVTLKIATLAPGSGDWMKRFRQAIKEIKQKTNGRVNVKIYPGGVMGNDATTFRKMRIGQIDGASFTAGGIAAIYPDFQVLSMPLLFRDYKEVDYVRSKIDPIIMKNLEARGYVPFFIADTGFVYIMSNSPISKIADLKGLKIWIPEGDPIGRTVFELAGVPPIPLPLADVLTGLRTGLIDTLSSTPSGALLFQWHSKVKYITDIPILYAYGSLIFSKRGYNKIPKQDREIVRGIIREKMEKLSQSIRDYNNQSLKVLKKRKIKFVAVNGKNKEAIEAFGEKVRNRLLEQNLFSKEIAGQIRKILKEYRRKK